MLHTFRENASFRHRIERALAEYERLATRLGQTIIVDGGFSLLA